MISYYEVLGVAPYATKEQIEHAYRWLVQKFHPDRNAEFKEEAKAQFVRIQEAFDTLSDSVKRLQYDQELRRARQRNPNAAAAETHEVEPPTKKSEKRRLAISPLWVTLAICFAVLAISVLALRSLSDVPSANSQPVQAAASIIPQGNASDGPKAAKHDILPVASVWKGAWTCLEPVRAGGDLTLRITKRDGNHFEGEMLADNDTGCWKIEGLVKGTDIEWKYVTTVRGPDLVRKEFAEGEIFGNLIETNYRIEGGDKGIGILRCDDMPNVDEISAIERPNETSPKIPVDAVEFKGHHYKYFDDASTWYIAKRKCEKMGGHLICIVNAEEDSFSNGLLEKAHAANAWIGGNCEEKEGNWQWVHGEPFSYTHWGPNTPDNIGGRETCIELTTYFGFPAWNDAPEGMRAGFICEWEENLSDVSASDNRTSQKSASQDSGQPDLSADKAKQPPRDILPLGSVWKGAWIRYLPNRGAGDTSLTITQRTGDIFQGEMHSDNDAHIWLVEGYAKGNQIEWKVNKAIKASDFLVGNSFNQGTINGNHIDVKWRLGNDSGVDLLKCDELPWDVGQQGDVKEMQIPGDAVEFNGHHYKYFDEKSTWYAAKQKCERMGGHLICVGAADEESFAEKLMQDSNAVSAWIGASNDSDDGVWRWVNGDPISYSHWGSEQPDNNNGIENCAEIRNRVWNHEDEGVRWNDYPGGNRQGFICEWNH